MTAAEETYWAALHAEEPFGYTRIDSSLAQIAQLLFHINAKTPAPSKSYKPQKRSLTDFMLFYRRPAKQQDNVEDQLLSAFTHLKDQE